MAEENELSEEVLELLRLAAEDYAKYNSDDNKVEYNGARGNITANGFTEKGQGSNF